MAGGLLGGGGVIAVVALFRPDVTYLLLGLVPPLFALGALAGFTLGAGLGWLARSGRTAGSRYAREMCVATACAVPGLAGAAAITFWIAYPTVLASAGRPRWIIAALFGWAAAMFVFGWALTEGWKAIRVVAGVGVARPPRTIAGNAIPIREHRNRRQPVSTDAGGPIKAPYTLP